MLCSCVWWLHAATIFTLKGVPRGKTSESCQATVCYYLSIYIIHFTHFLMITILMATYVLSFHLKAQHFHLSHFNKTIHNSILIIFVDIKCILKMSVSYWSHSWNCGKLFDSAWKSHIGLCISSFYSLTDNKLSTTSLHITLFKSVKHFYEMLQPRFIFQKQS